MSEPDNLERKLKKRLEAGNYRSLDFKPELIDFTSNDYLGLARSKSLSGKIHSRVRSLPNGSTGSRLLSGNNRIIIETEQNLSDLLGAEDALIFNSGYMANLAVFSALLQRGDSIIYDELSHACIKDGIRLSMASKYSFKHNDLSDLVKRLNRASRNKYIAIESIYSMDGDETPLLDIIQIAKKYNAKIIIDEAHGTGVLGKNGGGLSEKLRVQDDLFVRICTFGKAMGVHGAVVLSSTKVKEYLINFARPFIYTTAPAPYSVVAMDSAFKFLKENTSLQEDLGKQITLFKKSFDNKLKDKFEKIESNHAIQSVLIPGNKNVRSIAEKLQNDGFDVRPILAPTVQEGKERIRICLHTFNSSEEISGLIDSLASA